MILKKHEIFAFYLVLAIGVISTFYGLFQQAWPSCLPWRSLTTFAEYFIFLALIAFLLKCISIKKRVDILPAALILMLLLCFLSGSLLALIFVVWFFVSSTILGMIAIGFFGIDVGRTNQLNFFIVGAGLYGTLVGICAHFPINYYGVYGFLLMLPIFLGRLHLIYIYSQITNRFSFKLEKTNIKLNHLSLLIAVFAVFHLVIALLPEVSFDALALHLFVPSQLALRHSWGFDPSLYAMALIPMMGDWLFSLAYVMAGETGARLLNLTFTYVLALQAREVVIWLGGNEKGAKWSMLLFLVTPLTLTETASLHVEAVWTVFLVAGFVTLFRLVYKPNNGQYSDLVTSGLTLGFAASAKAITFIYLPAIFVLIIYRWRLWVVKSNIKAIALGLTLFITVGGIPYLTAWVIAGNPVHPFFNVFFKSPYYPLVNFDNTLFKSEIGWDIIYRLTFESDKYLEATIGASGFQWILLLPVAIFYAILTFRHKALVLLAVILVSTIMVVHSQSYLRYIYPSFLFLCAFIGLMLSRFSMSKRNAYPRVLMIVAGFVIFMNASFITAGTWTYRYLPLTVLFGPSERDSYLKKNFPVRKAVELVNLINSFRTPVTFFSQPFGAGLNADALYPNWYNHKFQEDIESADDSVKLVKMLSKYNSSIIILESSWGTQAKRDLVTSVTRLVADFGDVSVRVLKDEFTFTHELLDNSDFTATGGWTFPNSSNNSFKNKILEVRVNTAAYQSVPVKSGYRYKNIVNSRCKDAGAQGRVQVNWQDDKGQFISTDILPFQCTLEWSSHSLIVIAPKRAAIAIVYASAHTDLAIEVNSVNFKSF